MREKMSEIDRQYEETLARWARYLEAGVAVDHETVLKWVDQRIAGDLSPWPIPDG